MPISAPTWVGGRRFRPKLVPSLAAIVVIVATVMLGNWQSRRADYRGALQAQADAMSSRPALEVRRASDVTPADRYRRAVAHGQFAADRQIWLDNRTYRGTAGYHILTPLLLDDGTHLLVDRGWTAATLRREPPAANPPPGSVDIGGRLNQPPPSFVELKHVPPTGRVVQNLDLAEFASLTGLTLAPLVLEQIGGPPDGLIRDWPAPDLGRDKNVGYMWQWYGFAALTFVLWLVFGWRKT